MPRLDGPQGLPIESSKLPRKNTMATRSVPSRIIRASQGNFEHTESFIKEMAEAHNLTIDDIDDLVAEILDLRNRVAFLEGAFLGDWEGP